MKKFLAVVTTTLLASASAQTVVVQPSSSLGLNGLEFGVSAGYASGISGGAFVHAPNVAGPLGLKLGADFTSPSKNLNDSAAYNTGLDLGTIGDARKNYGLTDSGSHTTLSLDGTYNLGQVGGGLNMTGYAGGRYGMFSASETSGISGATSTATTKMNSYGVGAGVMLSYPLSRGVSVLGDLGVDQYFGGALQTTTVNPASPNGTDTYTYSTKDADYAAQRARFAFPGTVLKAKIGVKFNLR